MKKNSLHEIFIPILLVAFNNAVLKSDLFPDYKRNATVSIRMAVPLDGALNPNSSVKTIIRMNISFPLLLSEGAFGIAAGFKRITRLANQGGVFLTVENHSTERFFSDYFI